jgi:hypothetical protein
MMDSQRCAQLEHGSCDGEDRQSSPFRRADPRRLLTHPRVAGLLSLGWLLMRTGLRPSRLSYPCQQAALSTGFLLVVAPLVAMLVAVRRRVRADAFTAIGVAVVALGVFVALASWGHGVTDRGRGIAKLLPPADHRSQVFHVTNCPAERDGDHFPGLDNLIDLMGRNGLKFYRSTTPSRLGGPDGIIGVDDVVVIKINYQWSQRGGTNVDLLHGLVRAIIAHPGGFTGEVVVCENAQFASVVNFDRAENNAEDRRHSPYDVVARFRDQDHRVSTFDWTDIRMDEVTEYSDGDQRSGYVVYPHDAHVGGRVSYPKFETEFGTKISLRDGIWSDVDQSYDRDRLTFINVPVLKSHHSTYGVTACVKNYMGVVTDSLGTDSHNAIRHGVLGALLAEIGTADLNILDCIWVNAKPHLGPMTVYSVASRRDELVASIDPIAADIWATTHILVPAFIESGYTAPWPYPSADPENPYSAFRTYLDNSMTYLLAAGAAVTNDPAQIDAITWDGTGLRPARRPAIRRAQP